MTGRPSDGALVVAEERRTYRSVSVASVAPAGLSEADLSRIWEGQTFPAEAMTARDGTRLRVVYRGRRGHGPGPDFRDAIISAPYGLLEGDVELHLRASDFHRHGHDADPAYDGVMLHLVVENDVGVDTVLASGRRVLVVALGDWLTARSLQIEGWLEGPARFHEPCRDSLERTGQDVGRTLDRLGDIRFRARTAAFGKWLAAGEEPDHLAWRDLLEALGYGGERQRFQALADAAPWGLIKKLTQGRPVAERRRLVMQALVALDGGEDDRDGQLRPANRFARRLEGAAALATRLSSGFVPAFLPVLSLEGKDGARETVRLLEVPRSVGRSRAAEIAANVILPLLAAIEGGRYERPSERLYALMPLPTRYGAVRHLHEAVGTTEQGTWNRERDCEQGKGIRGQRIRINARRQQGMLYLLKQYCTEGGCGRCPLS